MLSALPIPTWNTVNLGIHSTPIQWKHCASIESEQEHCVLSHAQFSTDSHLEHYQLWHPQYSNLEYCKFSHAQYSPHSFNSNRGSVL